MQPPGEAFEAIAAALWPRHVRRLRCRLVQAGAAALLVSGLLLLLNSSKGSSRLSEMLYASSSPIQLESSSQRRLLLDATAATEAAGGNLSEKLLQLRSRYWEKVGRHFPNGGADSPQYRILESRCSAADNETEPPQALQPPIGFADYPYLLNSEPCTGRVSIVLAVHSAVGHAERRRVIRQTWGSVRYVNGRRLMLVFFLGRPAGGPDDGQLQAAVAEEEARHRDIVQRDFVDTYRNMTIKHLGIFDWLFEFCQSANWLVKVDDDVFVDVFHLEAFLGTYRPGAGLCCKVQSGRPEREPSDKWFVTRQEFPAENYPKYCEGYAYVIKPTLARLLYWCSVFSRHLWIDDVYVLGILVQRLGLEHQPALPGHLWADLMPSHTGRAIVNNIFLVDRRNGLQPSTWRRLFKAAVKHSY